MNEELLPGVPLVGSLNMRRSDIVILIVALAIAGVIGALLWLMTVGGLQLGPSSASDLPKDPAPAPEEPPKLLLSGHAVYSDGTPAAGIQVTVINYDAPVDGEVTTDATGWFQVPGDHSDSISDLYLRAESEGVASLVRKVPRRTEPLFGDLVLLPAADWRLQFCDSAGDPIVGVEVDVLLEKTGEQGFELLACTMVRHGKTDAEGLFAARGLPIAPGWNLKVLARHESYAPLLQDVDLDGRSPDDPISIRMGQGMVLSGRLLRRSSESGACRPLFKTLVLRMGLSLFPFDNHIVVAETDFDGSFRVERMPTENAQLSFSVFVPNASYYLPRAEGRPGDTVDLGDCHFEERGEIRGIVVDEAGAPVANAWVVVTRPGVDETPVVRDAAADGTFIWDGLPPGKWRVRATCPFRRIWGTVDDVKVGTEDLLIRISPKATVLVLFRHSEAPDKWLAIGEPEIQIEDRFWSPRGGLFSRFRFAPGLGEHRVTVRVPGYEAVDCGVVRVVPDQETILEVPLTLKQR
ncbi:MAG: carboxypeptidase-like regulatory domain-containing protein [Planctomycetota bacterium]